MTSGPVGVGVRRRRGDQHPVPAQPHELPRPRRPLRRRPRRGEGARAGRRVRDPRRRTGRSAARRRRGRDRRQPDGPGRARGRRAARGGRGEARLEREADRAGPQERPRAAGRGPCRGGAGGGGTGHVPRTGHPDGPPAPGVGCDRRAAERADPHAEPGPRVLAPQPRLPVPGRRGPAARHRPLLPHDARAAARAGRAGAGRQLAGEAGPDDRHGPSRGPAVRGDRADAGERDLRARGRNERGGRVQLRLGPAAQAVRGDRCGWHARGARPEHVHR